MARTETETVVIVTYTCDARDCGGKIERPHSSGFGRSGWRAVEVKRLTWREPNLGPIVTSMHLCAPCFAELVERS